MKKLLSILVLAGSLLLAGCQDDSGIQASEHEAPNKVKDGTVSISYYTSFEMYMSELAEHMIKINEQQKNRTVSIEEFKYLIKDGLVFANGNKAINTNTSIDREIEDYRYKVNYYFNERLDYMLKLINTNDKVYHELFKDANNNYNHNSSILKEILEKHDLN